MNPLSAAGFQKFCWKWVLIMLVCGLIATHIQYDSPDKIKEISFVGFGTYVGSLMVIELIMIFVRSMLTAPFNDRKVITMLSVSSKETADEMTIELGLKSIGKGMHITKDWNINYVYPTWFWLIGSGATFSLFSYIIA